MLVKLELTSFQVLSIGSFGDFGSQNESRHLIQTLIFNVTDPLLPLSVQNIDGEIIDGFQSLCNAIHFTFTSF